MRNVDPGQGLLDEISWKYGEMTRRKSLSFLILNKQRMLKRLITKLSFHLKKKQQLLRTTPIAKRKYQRENRAH